MIIAGPQVIEAVRVGLHAVAAVEQERGVRRAAAGDEVAEDSVARAVGHAAAGIREQHGVAPPVAVVVAHG